MSHVIRHAVTNEVLCHFEGEVPRSGDIVLVPKDGNFVHHICRRVEWEITSRSTATVLVAEL